MLNFLVNPKRWMGVAGGAVLIVACIFAIVSYKRQQQAAVAQNQSMKQAPTASKKTATPKPVNVSNKETQPLRLVTLPKGTAIMATLRETLASDQAHAGDSFDARLSAPIEVDGKTVIPKGARMTGRVVKVKKRELKVALASVVVRGKSYDLETNAIRPSDKNQPKSDTKDTSVSNEKRSKDVATLVAQTQLTFKLAKPIAVPTKG